MPNGIMPNPDQDCCNADRHDLIEAYLGVDVGSVSTNVVVIDREMRVLSKRYLPTAGRPIEAVKQGLAEVGSEIGSRVRILGAGTTGSGRYLTGDMIGADVVRNEITAQATAAAAIDPSVDTIFEIGGQDSKYISLRDGAVVDFEMNKACAAGTGSFLEEQAERLGIRIKQEFEDRAFRAASPCRFGERCTVFMESDLVHSMNTGSGVEELTAGLAYSIAYNYLNKVVAGKRVGDRIFFQGGVASNKAVVSAFEIDHGQADHRSAPPRGDRRDRRGPPGHAARAAGTSTFKGFDLSSALYTGHDLRMRRMREPLRYPPGELRRREAALLRQPVREIRCKERGVSRNGIPDLFAERERLLQDDAVRQPRRTMRRRIGIPRALYVNDFLPFWQTFFARAGLPRRAVGPHEPDAHQPGARDHGCRDLLPGQGRARPYPGPPRQESGHPVPAELHPVSRGTRPVPELPGLSLCPGPSLYRPVVGPARRRQGSIEPVLLSAGPAALRQEHEVARRAPGKGIARRSAGRSDRLGKRRSSSCDALEERGRQVLSAIKPGRKGPRPHRPELQYLRPGHEHEPAGQDPGPRHPGHSHGLPAAVTTWTCRTSRTCTGGRARRSWPRRGSSREHPNLYPVYITNFGCGPDSFITHFFRQEMAGKPFLQLEIDEHSADAGAITRIEAFLDSLGQRQAQRGRRPSPVRHAAATGSHRTQKRSISRP